MPAGALCRAEREFHAGEPERTVFLFGMAGSSVKGAETIAERFLSCKKGIDARRIYATLPCGFRAAKRATEPDPANHMRNGHPRERIAEYYG